MPETNEGQEYHVDAIGKVDRVLRHEDGWHGARLIVNADDFGWSRSITDGILCAHREGIVTDTSLLANQPASEYGISQLPSVPRLGVGIHLNLCSGAPVLPAEQVPSLVGADGNFHSAPEMLRRLAR